MAADGSVSPFSSRRVAVFSAHPRAANWRLLAVMRSLSLAGCRVTLFTREGHDALVSEGIDVVSCLTERDGEIRVEPLPDLTGFDVVQVVGRDLLGQLSSHVPDTAKLVYDVPEAESDRTEKKGRWLVGLRAQVGAWRSAPRIDAVLCPSYVFGEYLQREMQLKTVPVVPIYPAPPYLETVVPDASIWGQKGRPAVAILGGDYAEMGSAVAGVGRLRDVDLVVVNGHGDWAEVERMAQPFRRLAGRLHRITVPEDRLIGTLAEFRLGLVLPIDTSQQDLYDAPWELFLFLMAGVPVVASDLPGISRLIVAQNFGLLVDPQNPEQVADHVGRICDDDATWERLRHNVNVVRRQRYSWEVQEKRLLAIYSQLLGVALDRPDRVRSH